jgi:uncharacterized protein YrrD
MKNISFNAPVYSSDQLCGYTTYILVNPQTQRVTRLVVKEGPLSHTERLVPIEAVAKTSPDRIQLRCTYDEFRLMEPFIAIERHVETVPDYEEFKYTYEVMYNVPEKQVWMETKLKQVPLGELAVHQGARVQATDGLVGCVTGLRIEPTSRRIKQLLIEQGLPWDRRQMVVPIQQIAQGEENVVYLKLDKHSLDALTSGRPNQNLGRNPHIPEHF